MLHMIKSCRALSEAVQYVSGDDALLLIEDAVYAANAQHQDFSLLMPFTAFVLNADAQARAISNRISPSVTVVDYSGFVDLTAAHTHTMTWD